MAGMTAKSTATTLPENTQTFVSYQSKNRLLIMGSESDLDQVLRGLPAPFILFWLPNNQPNRPKAGVETLPRTEATRLSGYLGQFRLNTSPDVVFDQVLDFQQPQAITSHVAPFGYYAISDLDALDTALSALPEMIGDFDKPRYFRLDASLCAHQQNGVKGCQRCIEVCATDAIQSVNGKIDVNPWLCQGCGDCSSVCPSGAISYQHPDLATTLQAIKSTLSGHRGALLFYSGAAPENLPANIRPFALEALGVINLAICLNAIAYGAEQILIRIESSTPQTRQSLDELISQGNALLKAMGLGNNRIVLTDLNSIPEVSALTIPPAHYQPEADKRRAIRMATDYINMHVACPATVCKLDPPANFGRLNLDKQACTLCMACVSVCPAQALQSGTDLPQLKFIEANCLQCKLCQHACPEQAIELEARYLFDSHQARKAKLLHEEKPFLCINCQKPFATESMINTIVQKLQHHPMFQGQRKQQLLLCEDCKIAAHFNEDTPS